MKKKFGQKILWSKMFVLNVRNSLDEKNFGRKFLLVEIVFVTKSFSRKLDEKNFVEIFSWSKIL